MIRRPPRSTPLYSSAASDVYKRQAFSMEIDIVDRVPPLRAAFAPLCYAVSSRNVLVHLFVSPVNLRGRSDCGPHWHRSSVTMRRPQGAPAREEPAVWFQRTPCGRRRAAGSPGSLAARTLSHTLLDSRRNGRLSQQKRKNNSFYLKIKIINCGSIHLLYPSTQLRGGIHLRVQ